MLVRGGGWFAIVIVLLFGSPLSNDVHAERRYLWSGNWTYGPYVNSAEAAIQRSCAKYSAWIDEIGPNQRDCENGIKVKSCTPGPVEQTVIGSSARLIVHIEVVESKVCRGTIYPDLSKNLDVLGYAQSDKNDPEPGPQKCPTPLTQHPINTATGNKYYHEVDYVGAGPFPLKFERHFNSRVAGSSGTFPLWTHSYRQYLRLETYSGILYATAYRADGKVIQFKQSGDVWNPVSVNTTERLTSIKDSGGNLIGVELLTDDDVMEAYDANGRLNSLTDRSGIQQTLTYSATSIVVTHSSGRTLTLTYKRYNENEGYVRLEELTDPSGATIGYKYDDAYDLVSQSVLSSNAVPDNISSVVYQDGTSRHYHYDNPQFPMYVTGISDETGQRYASASYDTYGRAISSELGGGIDRVSVSYDAAYSTSLIDGLGQKRTYGFNTVNGKKRLASVQGGACVSCGGDAQKYTYNANGFVVSKTDFNGSVTTYVRDTRGLETSRTEAKGTAQARTITTEWRPTYRVPLRIAAPGKVTTFQYDDHGRLTERTETDSATGAARTVHYIYNTLGLVASVDGPRSDVSDLTTYDYDTLGNLTSVTDAIGHITRILSYDAHGRPLTLQDANGTQTELAYDLRGRLTSRTVDGQTTRLEYDGAGNLIRIDAPDGSYVTYTYDAAHRLTGISDAPGNRVTYTLDSVGNHTREETFDPAGALVRTHSRVYNGLNKLAQELGAGGESTAYTYDANGNRVSVTTPLSEATGYAFDVLNRLGHMTDALNGVTNYSYDASDRLTHVQSPNGATTDYVYDGLGNLTRETSPDRGTQHLTYDEAGNVLSKTDARGVTASYTYDALNRVTTIDYPGTEEDVTYTYDLCTNGIGRLCTVTDVSGTTHYAYDLHGNVTEQSRTDLGASYITRYGYDAGNRLTSITYPGGRSVSYAREALGRVSGVYATVNGVSTTLTSELAYRADGALAAQTFGNGLAETRSYDLDGRLTDQTLGASTHSYSYDANGNMLAKTLPTGRLDYGYDALARLINDTAPGAARSYGYDPNGNRTSDVINGDTTGLIYLAASNRLASRGSETITHDTAGNRTSDHNGSRTLEYNNAGRLYKIYEGGTLIATYVYNHQGQRTRKETAAGTTVYHYDLAGNLIAESTSQGAPLRDYVYRDSEPVAQIDTGSTTEAITYLHTDHIGTPRRATDKNGVVMWAWQGDAFGNTLPDEDPDNDGVATEMNLRFPGQYYDEETGLHYNYHRYYDPSTGRYSTSDPMGLGGGLNTYSYAMGNPLNLIDPDGLCPSLLDTGRFTSSIRRDKCIRNGQVDYYQIQNRGQFIGTLIGQEGDCSCDKKSKTCIYSLVFHTWSRSAPCGGGPFSPWNDQGGGPTHILRVKVDCKTGKSNRDDFSFSD